MFRPGGMSSDESDWDDDYFSQEKSSPPKEDDRPAKLIPLEEQFISAVIAKDYENVKKLLEQGVDINYKSHWNAILHASSSGSYEILQLLIEKGSDVNSTHEKFTPILAVCSSTCRNEAVLENCLDLLISKGGKVNVTDWYGVSPLSHAIRHNHKALVSKLISNGANINHADQDGCTPIYYAVENGFQDLVGLLKDNGANIYFLDRFERTLVDVALDKDYNEIALLLCENVDREDWIFQDKFNPKNVYDNFISRVMCKNDRLAGFSEVILNILGSVQLSHLNKYFRDCGLGHFLTISENELKNKGIIFYFERRKIIHTIKKFSEYPWGTSSFEDIMSHSELDLLQIAQLMATITRQLYIISITCYSWAEEQDTDKKVKIRDILKENMKTIRNLSRKLKFIQGIVIKIDKQTASPSDLILPINGHTKSSYRKYLLIAAAVGGLIFYKRNLMTSYLLV